jgi:hypothetical protein
VKSQRFDASAPLAIGSLTRAEPIRARTMEADAGVLFAQAGITALLLFLWLVVLLLFPVTVPGAWVGEWREWAFSGVLATVKAALLIALLVALGLFAWLAYRSERLLWKHEHMQAQPEQAEPGEPRTFRVEINQPHPGGLGGRRTSWLDVPVPPELFVSFALAAVNGRPLTQGTWTGQGNPFSRAQFDALRDRLIELGLAAWRNQTEHARGVVLTTAGRHVLQAWLDQFHASTREHATGQEKQPAREETGE